MSSAGNPPGRKRARPSNASGNASRRPPADDASRPPKRSRPSAGGAPAALSSRSSAAALLRGPNPNVARNRIGGQPDTAASASRPSLHDVTPSQIQNKPPPRRRSAQTKTAAKRMAGPAQAGGRSGSTRRRPQQESSPDEQPLSRSRRRADEAPDGEEEEIRDSESEGDIDDDDDDDGPPSPEKPYPHVAPFTRRVRQSTIETKWSPLGRGSLKALTSILQLAQRPVLQRLTSSSAARAAPTEAALRLITKRILDKIRGVAARDTLERQLDPVLHAVDLLGAETRRMEDELERDYERLRLMEAEARTRARENRSLLKKAHVLAPEDGAAEGGARGEDGQGVKFDKTTMNPFQACSFFSFFLLIIFARRRIRLVLTLAAWLQNIEDPEIKDMVATLGAHVDRLQANVEQTTGVGEQIQRTRAALQAVLAARVGAQTYEHVVLGR
ncbi:hypothetical protein CCM_00192 [Cordyceps militaris CM01]|uniref:Uncharacterized protein n=1 Tax=Cordyceps militaris (strain CM01) TaxID=983644 RepID=G3J2K2_CORMM|nr:uncharacterized protein CCM_00192 [Cordyceps militaris CM01]EGX95538.1 hypothetical protein CCM_00192 [Cordyceps militaris CM01]